MAQQQYSNHSRFVPGYHYFTTVLVLFVLLAGIVKLVHIVADPNHTFPYLMHDGIVPVATGIVLVMLFIYCRTFALKAQDRAIRAEESLRYFILSGKPMDKRLTMSQIIALRFAPDEELLALAAQAAEKNLSSTEIKKAVKHWRADEHRA